MEEKTFENHHIKIDKNNQKIYNLDFVSSVNIIEETDEYIIYELKVFKDKPISVYILNNASDACSLEKIKIFYTDQWYYECEVICRFELDFARIDSVLSQLFGEELKKEEDFEKLNHYKDIFFRLDQDQNGNIKVLTIAILDGIILTFEVHFIVPKEEDSNKELTRCYIKLTDNYFALNHIAIAELDLDPVAI